MPRLANVRTSTLTPDEALRQYTLARQASGTPPGSGNNVMRTLYSPAAEMAHSPSPLKQATLPQLNMTETDFSLHTAQRLGVRTAVARTETMYTEGSRYSVASG